MLIKKTGDNMKYFNLFVVVICITVGIFIGILFSKYIKPNNAFAGSVPYSNFNLECEYLEKASNTLGVGCLYRCKVPNGWLLIHDNKKSGTSNVYIPDPTNTWK